MGLNLDTTGPLLALSHILDLVLVLTLLGIALGLGQWALEKVKLETEDPLATIGFGTAVGLGTLGTTFLALGAVGWLNGWSLWILLLLAGVLSRRGLRRLPSLLARIPGFLVKRGGMTGSLVWGLVVLGAVSVFLLIFGAAPPVDWDSLMYHLPIPTLFLDEGRILLPSDNLHVSFVGLLHMLYLPLLAVGSTAGPALLNGALAILLGLTLFSLGTRFFSGETGSVSMGLVWGTTTILLVAITPRTDVTLALFLILAHYAFLLALEEGSSDGWPCLAAALVGFAAGVKFNGMAYGAGLAPLALWVAWRKGGAWPAFRLTAAMAGVGLVVLAPWLLKNWALLGAPFYPYIAERTVEPWLQTLYQALPTSAAPDPALSQALRGVRDPVNLWGIFLYPGTLTAELEGQFYFTNRVFLLLPLALVFFLKKRLAWLIIPPLLYLALILIPFPSTNLRYLVPAAPALTVAMAFVLLEVGNRYVPKNLGTLGVLILATTTLFPTFRAMSRWVEGTEAVSHFLGGTSEAEYWASHHDPGVRAFAPVVRHVNQVVSADSRILMLFEARGFPFEPHVIQDNKITNWPYLEGTLPEADCGETLDADYLLLSGAAVTYYRLRGLEPEKLRWDRFEGFADRCLTAVFQSPGYTLFRWGSPPRLEPSLDH